MYKYRITIITATYNRAYIIEKLYKSLQRQTYKNFEWIVIDDGSSDNTEELINQWSKNQNGFTIKYKKKENGGKHRAINEGIKSAKGELIFIMDSDDYLMFDALEKINSYENNIVNKKNIGGLVFNKSTSPNKTNNRLFGNEFDYNYLKIKNSYQKHNKLIIEEKLFVFYTEILRKFPFPEFAGEKFLTEAIIDNRIAHEGFIFKSYDDILWVYEYLNDGLSNHVNERFIQNPRGYFLWVKEDLKFQNKGPLEYIKRYYSIFSDFYFTYKLNEIRSFMNLSSCELFLLFILKNIMHSLKVLNLKK